MRITDLEKFALEQIVRPYATYLGYDWKDRVTSLPFSIEIVAEKLKEDTQWACSVIDRLRGVHRHNRITFPSYIQHPLVDVVRAALREREPK